MADPNAEGAGLQPHVIEHYVATGAVSGQHRAAWRCSCDDGRHCGTWDEAKGEWMFGASPELHLAEHARDRRNPEQRFERLRSEADEAENRLRNAVFDACGMHNPVQHRDGNAPWCPTCLRTSRGLEVGTR